MSLIRRRPRLFIHVQDYPLQIIYYHAEFFREALIQYRIEFADNLNQSTFHYNLQICLSI